MAFWLFAGADIGSQITTNSLRQKSSWVCLSTPLFLTCISPQTLICTVSWNWWKSSQTWVWVSQVFMSLLSWSNKLFHVSTYGMEKEGQKISGLSLAYLISVACKDVNPKDTERPKCFMKSKFSTMCLDVHFIMVDSTQLVTELKIWDLPHQKKIRADIHFSNICFKPANKLVFPNLQQIQKA